MRSRRPQPHTLAGAYALDALAGADRARFARHMTRCQQCAAEISGMWQAAARLASAAACEPPPGLTERAVIVAARTRQHPPLARGRAASRGARMRRVTTAVTAAAVAVVSLFGAAGLTVAHEFGEQQQRGLAVIAVLTAPDATLISAPVTTGGTVTIVMSRRHRELVFAAS